MARDQPLPKDDKAAEVQPSEGGIAYRAWVLVLVQVQLLITMTFAVSECAVLWFSSRTITHFYQY